MKILSALIVIALLCVGSYFLLTQLADKDLSLDAINSNLLKPSAQQQQLDPRFDTSININAMPQKSQSKDLNELKNEINVLEREAKQRLQAAQAGLEKARQEVKARQAASQDQ